jgi:hypothetical protein
MGHQISGVRDQVPGVGLLEKASIYILTILKGCCPNVNLFERSLKRFLFINLGEVKEKRFQLFELEERVLESPGTSLRFIKKCFRASEKRFGQQPVNSCF